MASIAIVFHSGYGHTAAVAESVRAGAAAVPGATVSLIRIQNDGTITDAEWATLDTADAIVFGAPTYMGSASGPFKTFADATSKVWMRGGWKDKFAAGFTNSGSWAGDKQVTLIQMVTLAAQHGMLWIPLGMMPGFNSSKGSPADLNRTGHFLGLGTQANADEGADVTPPASDHETAKAFGRRIAEITVKHRG
ncbi:flavodoxin family protein [Elioraea tepida]|jgi:multimeric flavodoxin WrbA|uniref:Flavodoxin family protein n=1 Tax=Elioraea tepida TaxID=2843330 RepID=A0A975YIG1_9PROT|nr:flavodoxin family protein [Elioraea tepida]QXM23770.1 flavodoxin family protein [Elioraea tepida]